MLIRNGEEGSMHAWMSGWDWIWMTFMMAFWLVAVAVVASAAVRLAQRPPRRTTP